MDRRLIAGLLGLLVVGCAQSRSGLPPNYAKLGPVGTVDALPPIKDDINRRVAPVDPGAKRATLAPDPRTPPAATGVPVGRPPSPSASADGSPRPLAPLTMSRPDDQPAGPRPTPAVEKAPSGPRPQSPDSPPVLPAPSSDAPPLIETGKPPTGPPLIETSLPPTGPPPLDVAEKSVDPAVKTASASAPVEPPPALKPGETPILGESGGMIAMVGKEVITKQQVVNAMRERLGKIDSRQQISNEDKQALFVDVLRGLIQRTLIIQAAKKRVSDPKSLQLIYDSIDKHWMDDELPPMLRAYKVANIHELRQKLAQEHRSLDQIREDFRSQALSMDFLRSSIESKLTAPLPEKLAYYNAHLADFERPAGVVWDEIEVSFAKSGGRAEARLRAEAILARLKKGEDFARIARAESHGATAREGGRWETGLNSSAIPDINDALNSLPPKRMSDLIETPGAFHIVRVAEKRQAGPARYDEVQDQVKNRVREAKFEKYAGDFVESLRLKTIVTTVFDPPASDPNAMRTGGPAR